jgi:hypothetical protein
MISTSSPGNVICVPFCKIDNGDTNLGNLSATIIPKMLNELIFIPI